MSIVNGVLVAIPPPEGYVVDFDNPQRNSVLTTYVVATVGMALAAAFVGQRLYVKAFIRNKLGIDDGELLPNPDLLVKRLLTSMYLSPCYCCLGTSPQVPSTLTPLTLYARALTARLDCHTSIDYPYV